MTRRTSDKLKVVKGTYQPCRAQKRVDPALLPLPAPPRHLPPELRKIWRELAKKAPHLRKPDQFIVEIACQLLHEFRTEPVIQISRVALLNKILADMWLSPVTRQNIPPVPEPNEFDEF